MKITKIGVHHSGPLSPTATYQSGKGLTEASINSAHKARTFNLSQMGFYIGYNVVIYEDGTWKQYRLLGEQTAAATGSNFNTFHICMIGNFTLKPDGTMVERPTTEQLKTLKLLITTLIENKPSTIGIKTVLGQDYSFTAYDIFPHRVLQPKHTSCYGNVLDDNFARNIAFEYLKEKNKANPYVFTFLCVLADYFQKRKLGTIKLGSNDFSDEGIIYSN